MIREFEQSDIEAVLHIWLDSNLYAHDFISSNYWLEHVDEVKQCLLQSELYVVEENQQILGFIGLIDTYIAGIFVKQDMRSKGIGKQLLDYVKTNNDYLSLHVFQKNKNAVRFYKREGFFIQAEKEDTDTQEMEYEMVYDKTKDVH